MNLSTTRVALERIGLGLTLVFFVVLLTLIFSVLGTISCAVLLGLMMGTARTGKGQALLVSLVFPGVILALMLISKALPWHQSLSLSAVCFGAFWMMYLLALGLMWLERSRPGASIPCSAQPEPLAARLENPPTVLGDAQAAVTNPTVLDPISKPPPNVLSLEDLQGKWSFQSAGANGEPCAKLIEILNDQVTLNIVDQDGQVRCIAKGGVRLEPPPEVRPGASGA